jgi:hypothetical protein
MANGSVVVGESEVTVSIPPFTNYTLAMFPPDTQISATLYISNSNDIPYGTTDKVKVMIVDWKDSQESTFNLDSYNYGKYIVNYPLQYIYIYNGMPVTMSIYFQYIEREYYEYNYPSIEDLTQLQTQLVYVTSALLPGTNFKFASALSDLKMSDFPLNSTFYVLDFQLYGTSSTSAGSVSLSWNSTSKYTINVGALGVNEDANTYTYTTDSTTQTIPGNATSTDAVANWVVVEYYSPLNITYTKSTIPIVYDSTTETFGVGSSSLSITANSSYLNSVIAPFALFTVK